MNGGKFASLTAGLLVRKGEARASSVMPASAAVPLPNSAMPPVAFSLPRAQERSSAFVTQTSGKPPSPDKIRSPKARGAAPPGDPPPPAQTDKPRRLMVSLSHGEYETLGIIGVKKSATRHQLLRNALDEYLALLVEEYSGECECIYTGGACGNSCASSA
jgi:hypothetical protein